MESTPYQCAMVTGASSGLGREFALQLVQRGSAVILVARREAKLLELANEIHSSGGSATVLAADLNSPDDRNKVAAA